MAHKMQSTWLPQESQLSTTGIPILWVALILLTFNNHTACAMENLISNLEISKSFSLGVLASQNIYYRNDNQSSLQDSLKCAYKWIFFSQNEIITFQKCISQVLSSVYEKILLSF